MKSMGFKIDHNRKAPLAKTPFGARRATALTTRRHPVWRIKFAELDARKSILL
jgi:hypothetical protein